MSPALALIVSALLLQAAPPPSLRFLSPTPAEIPLGATPVEIQVDSALPGDRVELFVDGRRFGSLTEPPWTTVWEAGDIPRNHELVAVLFRNGREVASGRLRTRPLGVSASVRARVVGLSPIVTDRSGHYVHGLTQRDFEVLDNGQKQEIESFDATNSAVSVVLVLDISGSMAPRIGVARDAAKTFLDLLKPEDEASLLTFNSQLVGLTELTKDKEPLKTAIDAAHAEGETALYDATASALRKIKAARGRRAVVLFTDGEDNRSRLSVDHVIGLARAGEVSILSIGLVERESRESETLRAYLERMAAKTGGRCVFISSVKKLKKAFGDILEELKSQYFLTYTPRDQKPKSWHRVEVRLKTRPELVVRARTEYQLD